MCLCLMCSMFTYLCFGFALNIELLETESEVTGDVITDDPGNKLETRIENFLKFAKSLLDRHI